MGRCVLAFPDYVLTPNNPGFRLWGGGWRPELPLANLLRREFAYVARSSDATLASTRFWVDFGQLRDVQVAALPRSNCSRDARFRLRGYSDAAGTALVADTGWKDLYPVLYPVGSLPWGHPSFWDGRMTEEDRTLYPMPLLHVFPATVLARRWLVEIDDTGNADGYVEIPRLVLARGWQPSLNISYGATQGWEDLSQVQTTPAGADFANPRPKRRAVRCSLQYLPQDEGMVWIGDMQARLGTTGQLLFCMDPDDAVNLHRRTFLCRMRTLSALEFAVWQRVNAAFDLLEIIA